MISVEVAYALPEKQLIKSLHVPAGTSVYDAAMQSGLEKDFPELDITQAKLGIFGKVVAKPQEQLLLDGDRVEIYRPLLIDPKEVRKARAAKAKQAETDE